MTDQKGSTPAAGPDPCPLSHAQEQLWFLDQLLPGQPVYNVPLALRLRGQLDLPRLHAALEAVVHRHQALRASFPAIDGVPVQVFAVPAAVGWTIQDLDSQDLDTVLADEAARAFSLAEGPLYRFRLFRLAESEFVLSMVFHHITVDGSSLGLICRDLAEVYQATAAGREPTAIPGPDWESWVRRHRQQADRQETLAIALADWEARLEGLPSHELPADRPRTSGEEAQQGGRVFRTLDEGTVAALRDLARAEHVSLFPVLAAAVFILLSRYTGEDDLAVGIPVSQRRDPSDETMVGLLINMAVLRADLADDPSFSQLLIRVFDAVLDIHEIGWVPFEQVVERLHPSRAENRNPLFQVSVQLAPDPGSMAMIRLPGVTVEAAMPSIPLSRFDLAVNFFQSPGGIRMDIEYSASLFDAWRIEALADHLAAVLAAAARDPGLRRSEVPLLSDPQVRELLRAGTGPPLTIPTDPLHVRIAAVAARQGDATAAVCGGREISYAELDRRAGILAAHLRTVGLRPGEIVGVLLNKDIEALVALLGILKAGAAFTVLGPSEPAARVAYQLKDAGVRLVVTQQDQLPTLPRAPAVHAVLMDGNAVMIEQAGSPVSAGWVEWASNESAAYVLYTSGSTGEPKGVVIEHGAMNCFAVGFRMVFPFCSADRILQLPSLSFDMAQGEIFTALTCGATLVLVPDAVMRSPQDLSTLMRAERVTYASLLPAMLAILEPTPYADLRYIMAGGDVLAASLVNKWNLDGRRMINMYGPTEAAVACAHYECEKKDWAISPPIGRPQAGRRLYVVDRWSNLAPRGIPGELLIGGEPGLAREYLGLPELTAEKFRTSQWGAGRVYRSGDSVAWDADLQLRFIGRRDGQIKLNGLRVELGEIESALLKHRFIEAAAVTAWTHADGSVYLAAYGTGHRASELTTTNVRQHLAELLPAYMIPAAWIVLAELPLTSSGKIDRHALPEPHWLPACQPRRADGWPSATEQAIATIFASVIGKHATQPGQRFFDLGGTSFQAMRVVSRIEREFGVRLTIRTMYQNPTVEALSATVDALRAAQQQARTTPEEVDADRA